MKFMLKPCLLKHQQLGGKNNQYYPLLLWFPHGWLVWIVKLYADIIAIIHKSLTLGLEVNFDP
jgi:hypothetical protein